MQRRVEGNVYTVCAVRYCGACGMQMINIGQPYPPKPEYIGHKCTRCGGVLLYDGLAWTYSDLFTRPISNEYKLEVSIPELITIRETQLQ